MNSGFKMNWPGNIFFIQTRDILDKSTSRVKSHFTLLHCHFFMRNQLVANPKDTTTKKVYKSIINVNSLVDVEFNNKGKNHIKQ